MISSYRSLRVIPLISSRLVVVICCFSDRVVPKILEVTFCLIWPLRQLPVRAMEHLERQQVVLRKC